MDGVFGWIVFLAVAFFVLRPLFDGFKEGARGADLGTDNPRGSFDSQVVGEANYQHNLLKIVGAKQPDGVEKFAHAELILEDENPHDNQAVRVDIDGLAVGYLPRERARAWRATSPGRRMKVPAVIRGGWDRGRGDEGNFGVWLQLS